MHESKKMSGEEDLCSQPTSSIASSNKGFQLLKKCGWIEGTGLGVAQQGRLEPLEAHVKKNKRGLGAGKEKKKMLQQPEGSISKLLSSVQDTESKKKAKVLSKRMKKMLEHERLLQAEKEFEMAFRREFWPDNV